MLHLNDNFPPAILKPDVLRQREHEFIGDGGRESTWNVMTTIQFRVDGEPKPQPRPKAFARNFGGGKWQARVYDPGTAEGWKSLVALAAKPHLPPEPLTCPVSVTIAFFMPRPKAHFNAQGLVKGSAPAFHTGRGDCDNLAKGVMDTLTQCGLWRDDGQVVQLTVSKCYTACKPGAEVIVREM